MNTVAVRGLMGLIKSVWIGSGSPTCSLYAQAHALTLVGMPARALRKVRLWQKPRAHVGCPPRLGLALPHTLSCDNKPNAWHAWAGPTERPLGLRFCAGTLGLLQGLFQQSILWAFMKKRELRRGKVDDMGKKIEFLIRLTLIDNSDWESVSKMH